MHPTFKETLITTLSGLSGLTAYGAILGMLLVCGLGVPIPEDITLVSAGILAALGNISLAGALIAGFVGVMLGDTILFFVGRKYGRRVFDSPLFNKFFTPKRMALAEQKVLRNSRFICFTARFLPGLRSPIFLTAGALGVRPMIFWTLDGLAALISVPVWVILGWWVGNNIDDALAHVKQIQTILMISVGTLIVLYLSWRWYRRRRLASLTQNQLP